MVETIMEMVEIESPSDNKKAADTMAARLAEMFSRLGGELRLHRAQEFGDHLQVDFSGDRGAPILLLGHYDTVYPLGTLRGMPCRRANGRIWGPGVLDMKSGIALMLHALEFLQLRNRRERRPVIVLLVSDEEVGSSSSRQITETLARKAAAVLVLEPSYGLRGAVKTARKGVGQYTIKVTGKGAHAGLDFKKGANAIVEMARQIIRVSNYTDLERGITVNAGTIQGGTRGNVVPAEAVATIDLRSARMKDAAGMDRKFRALKPFDRRCRVEVSGEINRPPMERTAAVAALFAKASEIARDLGWKLQEAAVGGASDGNFTAGMGIPTLDGLGGVGEGAHAISESVLISELPRRAALLAELIQRV